jgi:Tfp pilus assembly protein PilV
MLLSKTLINLRRSQKGETLVEIIISLFLLAVLITGVTAMIFASFGISNAAIAHAEAQQASINGVILFGNELSNDKAVSTVIRFYSSDARFMNINAEHGVNFVNDGGVITFYPIVSEVN